jgi:hypothetical protein
MASAAMAQNSGTGSPGTTGSGSKGTISGTDVAPPSRIDDGTGHSSGATLPAANGPGSTEGSGGNSHGSATGGGGPAGGAGSQGGGGGSGGSSGR